MRHHLPLLNVLSVSLLVICLFPVSALADTYPRQSGIDAIHYLFRLELSDTSDEIVGEATVELRFLQDGVKEVVLDFASTSEGKGMMVSGVSAGNTPVHFTHEVDLLRMVLAAPPKAGDHKKFTIRYGGVPADGLRIGKNKYGERTFFSLNWPNKARQWVPIIDHPYDKATSEFIITAPTRYQVVANGLLQEETDLGNGRRLTHWKQSVPIASCLNAIGVAQFSVRHLELVKGVRLQTWVYYQDRDSGIVTFDEPARQSMEFFSEHIGPYSYEKLANVEAAGLGGGTEHASVIFYGERSVTSRPAIGLVAHEIAHQWFGNAVTESDWDDAWLSEGFATYFTLLFIEHTQGRDALIAGLKRSREQVFDLENKNPGLAVRHQNLSDMKKVLNQIIYQKGGWTLHMLRYLMGTESFWNGIREYYRRYRDRNASTDDFRRVMEEVAGKDLSWFFQEWLNRAGSPVVEGTWQFNPNTKKVEIQLTQQQPGEAYRLSLEVSLAGEESSDVRVQKIEMTQREQKFELAVEKEPTSVTLDPNAWVLMHASLKKQ